MVRIHHSIALGLVGLGLIVIGMVRADAAGPAATKVGYVDLQRTLNETKIGKKARKRLERDKDKKQKELDEASKALEKAAAELNKQRAVLKPDVLRQREMELQQKYVKLQEKFVGLQQELAAMEAKLVRDIFAKAAPVIADIAKRDGYTMVLEKSESAVLWAVPSIDLTDEVNARLDGGK
ncbi:MAG: OmpH family outer membrane protein [Deltaproteobacteria bacterium]|nr:MAG: OmpH family outer membrane protein [Deltaproteobacteria bacterium]